MRVWTRFWQQMASRPERHAWGLACDEAEWTLVGLSLKRSTEVHVNALERIFAGHSTASEEDFSSGLRQAGTGVASSGRRLNVALKSDEMVAGVLELPADLPPDEWASEVQLEVSQLLGLALDEVSFDFQPDPVSAGLLSRVHWVGCDQGRIRALKDSVRAAGWQLHSVEPAWHAAHRAACHLRGSLNSLLTQPSQDWQFDLTNSAHDSPVSMSVPGRFGPDLALSQAMQSAAGTRLVAAGLALKAWR